MKIVITERQEDLLMENIPIAFRRRYDYNVIKNHLEFFILENNNACEYDSIGNFISDICDMMVQDLIDDFYQSTSEDVDNKTKDDLYNFMVHNFGYYLRNFYDKQCQ
jgi:uncharacterized protein YbgA (DUF1722 family)